MTPFIEALEKLKELGYRSTVWDGEQSVQVVELTADSFRNVILRAAQLGAEHVVRKVEARAEKCDPYSHDSCLCEVVYDHAVEAARQGLDEVNRE